MFEASSWAVPCDVEWTVTGAEPAWTFPAPM